MTTGKVTAIAFFVSLLTAAVVHLGLRAVETGGSPFQSMVAVPPVGGIDVAQARSVLEAQGLVLVVTRTTANRETPANHVISQSPVQGSQVKRGTAVAVVVSKGAGKATVPPLAGLTVEQAMSMLDKNGLRAGKVSRTPDPKVPPERVVRSSPPAGGEATAGDAVELFLSSGPAQIEVPALKGKSFRSAKEALEAAGLKVGKKRYGIDEDRPTGLVLRQEPEAGQKVAPGSAVDLVINAD